MTIDIHPRESWDGVLNDRSTQATLGPKMSKSVPSILQRIAAGDPNAFQECVDRYKGLIWWLARKWANEDAGAGSVRSSAGT